MKKIYFKPPSSPSYFNNGFFKINSIHNTYYNSDKRLKKFGIDINTIDLDKGDGDFYIYADTPYPWEIKFWLKVLFKKNKNVLLSLESPLVNPFNHLRFVQFFFKKIFTWDDSAIDNIKQFKFFVQQTNFGIRTRKIKFDKKKFLVFINNKKDVPLPFVLLSPYKENLYRKRFQVLDFFSKNTPKEFEFYGRGWNDPISWDIKEKIFGVKKYKTYKGEHKEDKIKTLSRYKFNLCFENAVAPGYITEKIFDSFKAGCVPIYWGAPNIEKYISKKCFIDYRKFKDLNTLLKFLKEMDERTYTNYLKEIDKFMAKKETKEIWFGDQFVKSVNYLVNK